MLYLLDIRPKLFLVFPWQCLGMVFITVVQESSSILILLYNEEEKIRHTLCLETYVVP